MDIEKAKLLSEKYLDNSEIKSEQIQYTDTKLSPNGWQYKRYGNSTKGKDFLENCRKSMKLISDNGESAKNDSDPRYYENLIFVDDDKVIQVSSNPSRTGKQCLYTFFIVTKI